jgi:hypothetical protein
MDKGQPRRFENEQAFIDEMMQYLQWCIDNMQFPNIAGFCVYAKMSTETFYQQKRYYSDAYEFVNNALETSVLNSHAISDTIKALYLKNKFKYADKVQQEISVPDPIVIHDLSRLSDSELATLKALTTKAKTDADSND